jgi:hypothetical protein
MEQMISPGDDLAGVADAAPACPAVAAALVDDAGPGGAGEPGLCAAGVGFGLCAAPSSDHRASVAEKLLQALNMVATAPSFGAELCELLAQEVAAWPNNSAAAFPADMAAHVSLHSPMSPTKKISELAVSVEDRQQLLAALPPKLSEPRRPAAPARLSAVPARLSAARHGAPPPRVPRRVETWVEFVRNEHLTAARTVFDAERRFASVVRELGLDVHVMPQCRIVAAPADWFAGVSARRLADLLTKVINIRGTISRSRLAGGLLARLDCFVARLAVDHAQNLDDAREWARLVAPHPLLWHKSSGPDLEAAGKFRRRLKSML